MKRILYILLLIASTSLTAEANEFFYFWKNGRPQIYQTFATTDSITSQNKTISVWRGGNVVASYASSDYDSITFVSPSVDIRLDLQGGKGVSTYQTLTHGSFGSLGAPLLNNASFSGWYTDATSGKAVTDASGRTLNRILDLTSQQYYAHWTTDKAPVASGNANVTLLQKESIESRRFLYTLDTGTQNKGVYFVFTKGGTGDISGLTVENFQDGAAVKINDVPVDTTRNLAAAAHRSGYPASMSEVERMRYGLIPIDTVSHSPSLVKSATPAARMTYKEGDVKDFNLSMGLTRTNVHSCLLRKTRIVMTKFGHKTLNIWANQEDNASVTDNVVNLIADKFLKDGLDNDIYDYETNMFGEEWGPSTNPNVIGNDSTINVVFYNFGNQVTLAYHFGRDNAKRSQYDGSNEAIAIYVNSSTLTNTGEVLSTMTHEFQHAIHFYRKYILNNVWGGPVWINELCSVTIEDLLSEGILGIPGPKGFTGAYKPQYGVTYGNRVVSFNNTLSKSETDWSNPAYNTFSNYGHAYVFGAYLLRNFGIPLFHEIITNKEMGVASLLAALKTVTGRDYTFTEVLRKMAASCILSDKPNQTGDFSMNKLAYYTLSSNNETFNVSSLNLHSYYGSPMTYTTQLNNAAIAGESNVYYSAGNVKGKREWVITLPAGVEMTVVTK